MSKPPKLSNVQNERMGGLLAVLCGRTPYPWLSSKLLESGFIAKQDLSYSITESGHRELERLLTLCGLAMFDKEGELHFESIRNS